MRLRRLGQGLTALADRTERNMRIIVTVPTLRLAGVAATLGSVLAKIPCRGCAHQQLERGARVTGWASGKLLDTVIADLTADTLQFAGIRLRGNRDTVHRLPAEFPDRSDYKLPDDLRSEIALALGCSAAVAGQRHSARCPHPVVVAGEPGAFRGDVTSLAQVTTGLHPRGRLNSGSGLDDWFRHPVLLMGAVPDHEGVPWAAELRPRLVILTGSAGWVGSSRRLWPDVPVLVLLSRRSQAACGAAALLAASGWNAPQTVPVELQPLLRPDHGLEITCVVEPDAAPEDEDLW